MCRTTNIHAAWFLVLGLICLTGCLAPRALKSDFGDYGKGYAESSDRQLLFNLARLANNDSVSFMQLVSISSEHQLTAGLGYNESVMHNSPGFYPSSTTAGSPSPTGSAVSAMSEYTKKAATYGGTANVGILEEPTFQFVPLSGSNIVSAVLAPISSQTFYELYDQGYPADFLLRTMVESIAYRTNITTNFTIEFHVPVPDSIGIQECSPSNISATFTADVMADLTSSFINNHRPHQFDCLTNCDRDVVSNLTINLAGSPGKKDTPAGGGAPAAPLPTPADIIATVTPHLTTNYEYWVNNPYDKTYPKFLQACEHLRYLQLHKWLTVNPKAAADTVIFQGPSQPLKDIISATQSNLTVKFENEICTVTKTAPLTYEFVMNSNLITSSFVANSNSTTSTQHESETYKQMDLPFTGESKVDSTLTALAFGGVAREPALNNNWAMEASDWVYKSTFKMKAVESAMFTAGKEESYFRRLSTNVGGENIQFTVDATGPFAWVVDRIPSSGSSTFSVDEIEDLSGIINRLRQPVDGVSDFIWNGLTTLDQQILLKYQPLEPYSTQAQCVILQALNKIIVGPSIFNNERFNGVSLRQETTDLAKQNPTGFNLTRLNRLLLEDAYTRELSGKPDSNTLKFSTNDIRGLASFAEKLSKKSDDVSRLLISKMGGTLDEALIDYYAKKSADPASLEAVSAECSLKKTNHKSLQAVLVDGLNNIILSTNKLCDFDAFKKLHLRPKTIELFDKNPKDEADEHLLNRLILEDAYPEEIRSQYFKVYPLMKLTCEGNETPFHNVLTHLDYRKDDGTLERYYVGDSEGQTQNRKVFTILTYLFESSAISTQNLPVQQLIEVH